MTAQDQITTKYTKDIFEPITPLSNTQAFMLWFKDISTWWYITMPIWYILSLRRLLTIIDDQFSISILFLNFFVPWHRDNSFVGFIMGIIMKLLFLPIGCTVFLTVLSSYLLFLLIWVLLPVIALLGIIFTPIISSL